VKRLGGACHEDVYVANRVSVPRGLVDDLKPPLAGQQFGEAAPVLGMLRVSLFDLDRQPRLISVPVKPDLPLAQEHLGERRLTP